MNYFFSSAAGAASSAFSSTAGSSAGLFFLHAKKPALKAIAKIETKIKVKILFILCTPSVCILKIFVHHEYNALKKSIKN
jgi:hypothetical protein